MSTTVPTLLAALATRIRDPLLMSLATVNPPDVPAGGLNPYSPTGSAFACVLLSEAQQAVNNLEHNVLARVSYTLTAGKAYYQVSSDATLGPQLLRPLGIQLETGYDLIPMPYGALRQANLSWYNQPGMPRSWAMAGADAFVVYPQPKRDISCTVVGCAYLSALTAVFSPVQSIQIDDSLVHKLLDVAEALAYLKKQDLEWFQVAYARMAEDWPYLKLPVPQIAPA